MPRSTGSAELFENNPWWKEMTAVHDDDKVQEWRNSVIKWDPRIRHTFDYSNDIVYSLRGPRQVGKTTMVKLQIKEFIENGISPWNIMYYAFDTENTPKELVDVVKNYLNSTKRQRDSKRCYLFLDEVSSIKDWQKGIKKLWDQNRLRNCTVIATGSHTVDIQRSNERLPGRRGKTTDAYDKVILPMKFSEYVSCIDADLKKIIVRDFRHGQSRMDIFTELVKSEIDKRIDEVYAHMHDLNQYLQDYLLTGGVPKVVDDFLKNGIIGEELYTTYLQSILGDLTSLNRQEAIFMQIASNLIKNMGWPVSWRSLLEDTEIGSQNTVSEYIFTLQSMFVLTVFFQYHSKRKNAFFEKEKKIYFHDPFFLHAVNAWINPGRSFEISKSYIDNNQGPLVEGVVGDHLIRLAFSLSQKKQLFNYSNFVFHWRYDKDKEVDYVLKDGMNIDVPIEVKFQNSINARDLDGLINYKKTTGVKNAFLITKDKLDVENECIEIPAAIFLLLV